MPDWEELLTEATARVQRACAGVAAGPDRAKSVGEGAAGDDTLVGDREAERHILESLQSVKDVGVLSEEAGWIGPKVPRYLAVVDPLDGSSNFSRGVPFYCSSICVLEGEGTKKAKWALVRNLVNGDVYYAESGAGAQKNKKQMRPSRAKELSASVAAVDLSRAPAELIGKLEQLLAGLRRVVHYGANALEICLVADGSLDAFVDLRGRMRITDVAAAELIAEEAGSVVTAEDGRMLDHPLDLKGGLRVVASANNELHRKILEELAVFTGRTP